ncbi:ParB/Srx family N-terminal domain-containing protein [Clostridium hydrogeniformans]|uniref:ParB/Srx family N-terminal domain-containing protein n=1 Tax=Clostridium hydrogeniformans TaxID=349933 RepID=UPI000480C4FD|nr:ParB/Srx family N-terminal domain-containing protein [Clostridium hydrogeniformans]
MKIEKLNIDLIIPYENNSKEHTEEQIEQIKTSIKEFGFNDPLAIDENNIIIEGHGRYESLKELGYEEVEVIRLSHLTELQKKQYIIAHNKLCLNTEFDLDRLEGELKSIKILEGDLNILGFGEEELKDILDPRENILDLLEDDGFVNLRDEVTNKSDIFSVTFNFDKKNEDILKNYISLNGKEKITSLILQEVKACA